MTDVSETLSERGARYGKFNNHANVTQGIKSAYRLHHSNWCRLDTVTKEALEMIAHKIGRIIGGDETYGDSWHDIAGYATLAKEHHERNHE